MVEPESNAYPALDAPAGDKDNLTLFVCPACGQRARVPKMFAGHSIKCPGCKTSQSVAVIHDQSSQGGTIMLRRPQEVTEAIEAEKAMKEAAAKEALVNPGASANATPVTGAALVLPPPSALMPKSEPKPELAPEFSAPHTPPHGAQTVAGPTIPFHCTKCLTESTVPAEYAGKVIKCPKCQAVQIALSGVAPMTGIFMKPKAAAEPAAVAPTLAGAPAKTAVLDERGRIVFTCSACRFSAYFAQSYGGKPIQCPACGTAQTIDPLPGQMITPATSAAAAAQAGNNGSGAAPVIGAGGVVISSGRSAATTSSATTPASDRIQGGPGRINSPAPQSVGGGTGRINSPAPQSVGGGTGRINSPAPQSANSPANSGGTGRVPNSKFNTPLPGSLTTPVPGQALTSRHKMPPPPTPMPPMSMPAPAAPAAQVPALSAPLPSAALVPIVNVPAPAPVIVHVPGPPPRGMLAALGVICVVLLLMMGWMMVRSTELATKRDALAVQLKDSKDEADQVLLAHDRDAETRVSAVMSAKMVAERTLISERDAHQRDAAALAAATAQLTAAKASIDETAAQLQHLQDESVARDKMELSLRDLLMKPDEEHAKLIEILTQSLVAEAAARNAAERRVRELTGQSATAAKPAVPEKK